MKSRSILILILSIAISNLVYSFEYHVDMAKKANNVKFISKAPLEDFEGNTQRINGYLKNAGDNLQGSELYFEVDLNSLNTGIGLRDQHMRDNYLETKKYPKTTFKGNVTTVTDKGNGLYEVIVDGSITIHGVTKQTQVKGTIQLGANDARVKSKFVVKLSDFKVKVPELMFQKINENIELVLDFTMKKVK